MRDIDLDLEARARAAEGLEAAAYYPERAAGEEVCAALRRPEKGSGRGRLGRAARCDVDWFVVAVMAAFVVTMIVAMYIG